MLVFSGQAALNESTMSITTFDTYPNKNSSNIEELYTGADPETESHAASLPVDADVIFYARGDMDDTMVDERDIVARQKVMDIQANPVYDLSFKQRKSDGRVDHYLWIVNLVENSKGHKLGTLACYQVLGERYSPMPIGKPVDPLNDPDYKLMRHKIPFTLQQDSLRGVLTDMDKGWVETTARAIKPDTYDDTVDIPSSTPHVTGDILDAIVRFDDAPNTETREHCAPVRVLGETALYTATIQKTA